MDAFLKSNNFVRLIAFVLAVMLWLVVRANTQTPESPAVSIDRVTEAISGNVDVQYNRDQVSLVGAPPEVSVKISGERLAVWQAKMQSGKLKFIMDARGLGEGVHEADVVVEGLPPGVSYEPVRASIRLEANLEQRFKLELTLDGNVDPSQVANVVVDPKEVVLVGPSSVIQQVQRVQARITSQIFDSPGEKRTVVVSAVNSNGKPVNVTIQPKTVDLIYNPPVITKEFKNLQPQVKGLAKDLKVLLPADGISLSLKGTSADLNAIKPEDIKIILDVTGLTEGDYVLDATVAVPDKVQLATPGPIKIPVKIIKQQQP